jgi:hypothetical protein
MELFGTYKMWDMGNKYMLTITDSFTNNAQIFAISIKEAETVEDIVFTKCICSNGGPSTIHTDGVKNLEQNSSRTLHKPGNQGHTHIPSSSIIP